MASNLGGGGVGGEKGYLNTPNQNYNKILKCDWLSPAWFEH